MADGASDNDVIHLASFNVHRSQGPSVRELITISDDSDEEPVTLVPGSPVMVPDDADGDDDISVLKTVRLRRRQVIRPAATWTGTSGNLVKMNTPTTSKDTGANNPVSRSPVQAESQRLPQPSTSAQVYGSASAPVVTQPQPGSRLHTKAEPQARAQPNSCAHTQAKAVDARTADSPSVKQLPANTTPQASSSTQTQPHVEHIQVNLGLQQPGLQAPNPPRQPQPQALKRCMPLDVKKGNVAQITEHPPKAPQRPVAPAHSPERRGSAVLIATAPERLGPPEAGHQITLGSQPVGEANRMAEPQAGASNQGQHQVLVLNNPPAPNPNARVPNPHPHLE